MDRRLGPSDPGAVAAAAAASPRAGRGLSLRVKITAAFVLIVVGGTAVSTVLGSRIITAAVLGQARTRVRYGLAAARLVVAERLGDTRDSVARAAATERLRTATRAGDGAALARVLAALQHESGVDFLAYIGADDLLVRRPGGAAPARLPGDEALRRAVGQALRGATVGSTERLPRATLAAESAELAARAHLPIVAVPQASPDPRTEIADGLVLVAAAPVVSGGRVTGALYGGVLLNRNHALVDHIRTLIYGGERYQGRDIGSVSIFLGDVRVTTNVLTDAGQRALGTRISAPVAHAVLARGEPWYGRAFVVHDFYVSAYEPLRGGDGAIIGILYVGMREAPFLAVRTDVMLSFLVLVVVGLGVVVGLTYLITRTMIHPLEAMVAATNKIAAGDLNQSVEVLSRDEVGHLAVSFNRMTGSLRTMQEELQGWAHTLEQKVRERTEQLVAVQARMGESEKLASVGRLAAGVAHEINNPLGGILTLAMLELEECAPDHPMRRDLETIVKQTLRCREIVKGLLDFSRQSAARAARVDLNATVDTTLALLERQPLFHNVRTTRTFAPDLPPVLIDPGQLQQVVMNLVLNAVDAMEESGDLTVATAADAGRGEVVLRISDTGAGIPPDVMPLIFEPFFTTKKVGQGTGLGLAIVHGIVTRAGGGVEAASDAAGTTFTVRLPVAAAAAAAAEGGG
jgi:two-component system NtrC family sensor kinase